MPDRFRHTKTIHIVLLILLALLSSCSPGVKKTEKELLVVNLSPESVQVHLTSDQGEDYTLCLEGYSSLPLTVPYGTKNLIVTPVGTYFQGSFTHSFLSLEPLWLEPVEPVVRNGERDPEGIFHSINHRGYNTVAPENTLSAFRLSKEKGFTQVETDVAFTLDGVPVLLHDSTIDRTSNGKGKIKNLKLEEVRSYDFGSWKNEAYKGEKIPTFEEFLCLVEELALEPYIEIKAGNKKQIQSLVETVSAHGLSNKVTWISFSSESLRFVIQKAPEARIGYLSSTLDNEAILTALSLRNGRNEVFLDARTIDDASITKCQALGIPLELWTIDDEETIANLDSYISGVTSNKTIAKDHLFP